ncbi:MAG: hypothetical protein JSU70_04515 [Phycisphaerales bacterium]|nr:MAG: hypothetical protein JSU70_04515 [Phycisphaerales bacterium]
MKYRVAFIICCAVLCVVGTSWAAPIKSYTPVMTGVPIDFEGFAEGTLISTQYAGITFGQDDGGTPMIDNYSWLYGYGCSSGSAVLTGSTTGGAPAPTVAGITLTFDSLVSDVQAFFSDTAPLGDYTIYAYDTGGILLESFTVLAAETLPPGYSGGIFPPPGTVPLPGLYVGFTRPSADIAWIQIGPSTAYPNDAFAIDDVQFRVIPAPGAVLLGGIGASLVGWLRRRRTL